MWNTASNKVIFLLYAPFRLCSYVNDPLQILLRCSVEAVSFIHVYRLWGKWKQLQNKGRVHPVLQCWKWAQFQCIFECIFMPKIVLSLDGYWKPLNYGCFQSYAYAVIHILTDTRSTKSPRATKTSTVPGTTHAQLSLERREPVVLVEVSVHSLSRLKKVRTFLI